MNRMLLAVFVALIVRYASGIRETYNGQYPDDCPSLCVDSGSIPSNWTHVHQLAELESCEKPIVFDFNIYSAVTGANAIFTIRACVLTEDKITKAERSIFLSPENAEASPAVVSSCGVKTTKTTFYPQIRHSAPDEMLGLTSRSSNVSEATQLLAQFVNSSAECGASTILFVKYQSIVVGLYSGAQISKSSAYTLLNSFAETRTSSLQICQPSQADLTIGISSTSFYKLEEVQNVVRSWASGICLNNTTPTGVTIVDVLVSSQEEKGNMTSSRLTSQSDGTCSTHKVVAGDVCWDLASRYQIQPKDIETFNRHTWGWLGCGNLQIGQLICISSGEPPMPAPIPGVTCGPQVPGTGRPPPGSGLAGLNPCPLNACCDIWGYCGITADFCTESSADTGAPGTAKPGTNGCISNCGVNIVNNGTSPEKFRAIGYFEAFDQKRVCLQMSCTEIPADKYSHVHFAFAAISPSFDIDISDVEDQLHKFSKMTGFKKILSFGGWAFSTDPSTFQLFRDATKSGNREKFVGNLVRFMENNNLDGFDFDWEYPGAPDIPNIPPGSSDEGGNYRDFLKLLRDKLPSGKSISVAIPASYWYLKQYPIKEIALHVDYFIYMTYDLHGQWDVGNKGAMAGCEAGNCLRSHINKTETHDAMAMITKAGLETRQIVIGITSYGRSFRMSQSSCSGPLCTFEGSRSQSMAHAAPCTDTRSYMANAEIKDVIKSHDQFSVFQDFIDKDSDSNVLIYGNAGAVDWVAYMDGDLKSNRVHWIESLNFGGSGDWAIDLESHTHSGDGGDQNGGGTGDDDDDDDDDGDDGNVNTIKDQDLRCPSRDNPGSLEQLADKADSLDEQCVQVYAIRILYSKLLDSLSLFKTNSKDYDNKFVWYERWTKEHIQSHLDEFMALGEGKGLKYFDCYWSHPGQKEKKGSCAQMPHMWDTKNSWTIRFDLTDRKGFFDALETETGIEESWVKFDNQYSTFGCENSFVNAPGSGIINTPCRVIMQTKKNYPMKGSDKDIHVWNPKKVIEGAAQNVTALEESIFSSYVMVGLAFYDDGPNDHSATDAISGYSMPVLQLAQAIESMKDIKDIGEKAASDAKKNLIVKILSIVFMVVPFAGEVIGPVFGSAAAISRIALLIGEVGNAALTVGEIIEDPQSAPFAIMDLIAATGIGPGKLGKEEAITRAAKVRTLMRAGDIAKFPEKFRKDDALVQTIVKGLCARK